MAILHSHHSLVCTSRFFVVCASRPQIASNPSPSPFPRSSPHPTSPTRRLVWVWSVVAHDERFLLSRNDNMPSIVWVWDTTRLALHSLLVQMESVRAVAWDPVRTRFAPRDCHAETLSLEPGRVLHRGCALATRTGVQCATAGMEPRGKCILLSDRIKFCLLLHEGLRKQLRSFFFLTLLAFSPFAGFNVGLLAKGQAIIQRLLNCPTTFHMHSCRR